MAFETFFSVSRDDGDELKRPTRTTPRPEPKEPEPEASGTSGETTVPVPKLEDLLEVAPILFTLIAASAIAVYVARQASSKTAPVIV